MIAAVVLAGAVGTTTSCTVGKPIVCAFTSIPALASEMVRAPMRLDRSNCTDPHAAALAIPVMLVAPIVVASTLGAVGGLLTGIASDVHWLAGNVRDPFKNLQNPFATSAVRGSRLWRPRVLR